MQDVFLLRPSRAGKVHRTKEDAAKILPSAIQDHWLYCNIHTIDKRYIAKKILDIYARVLLNVKRPASKQSDSWKSQMGDYNAGMEKLFDIFCEDECARKRKEQEFAIKMAE